VHPGTAGGGGVKVPEGWKLASVSDFISHFDSGVSVNGEDSPGSENEFGVLKVSAVTEGVFRPSENKRIEGAELDRAAVHPMTDRVLMSRANSPELVGACAYIDREYPNLFLPDKLWQFEPHASVKICMRWFSMLLSSPGYRRKLCSLATGTSMSMKNIPQDSVFKLAIPSPPLPEQEAIADTLSAWDAAIGKIERLIAAKERILSAHREGCFTQSRLATRVALGSVTHESSLRNDGSLGRDLVMAVTKAVGLRPMREETMATDIGRYMVVRPKAFAYNPMRLNIGSIAMSTFENEVLVSPDYVVFECDERKFLPGLFNHLRFTRRWANHFESAGNGGVRVRVHYDELAMFGFWLPPIAEQKKILAALELVAEEIELLRKKMQALRVQKRGLMQKLLTGIWRMRLSGDKND
jgi:type I restriction enzyme, S subunit